MRLKTTVLILLLLGLINANAMAATDPAVARVRAGADKLLTAPLTSVVQKSMVAPSGDKHDYLSLAPYAWPDPAKKDGLPWVLRDGKVNPASREGTDSGVIRDLCMNVQTLALAYKVSGDERYAAKAAAMLETWFIAPETHMNPNLNYAQGIPGKRDGNDYGLIETVELIDVVQAVPWLRASPSWPADKDDKLKAWFQQYLNWFLTSDLGRSEALAANNHGTWYLAQVAAFADFIGDTEKVRAAVEKGKRLVGSQIRPDGTQPQELRRANSYHYSTYNLEALVTLAEYGKKTGVDLFGYRTKNGKSIRAALDYMVKFFSADSQWPHRQSATIKRPDQTMGNLLRRAAIAYQEPAYEQLIQGDEFKISRFQLMYPAPALPVAR